MQVEGIRQGDEHQEGRLAAERWDMGGRRQKQGEKLEASETPSEKG